jgi:teichuronic acid biosynthesis glycosyltransferase TuaG
LKDSRIHYFREEEKAFVAKTRNDAMAKANGRYLAFLDSDDLWEPEKLQKQMELMRQTDTAFVYGGCDVIDAQGYALNKVRKVPEYITYEKLLWGNVIPCLTVLLDRQKTGDFQMPQIGHEDYATWLNILKKTGEAYGINEVLGSYRINPGSVSRNKITTIRWTWNIYRNTQGISKIRSLCYLMGHMTQALRKI